MMSTVRDFIIFTVDTRLYALPVDQVERINTLCELTLLSNAPSYVEGLISYQNHAIKVINLHNLIGTHNLCDPSDIKIATKKMIIYKGNEDLFALQVDTIEDIVQVENQAIKHYSNDVKVSPFMDTEGILEYKKRLVIVVKSIRIN